jgi:hypothetical protein
MKNTEIENQIIFKDNVKGPSGSSVSYYHFKTKGAYAFYFLKENNFCYNLDCTPQESNVIRFAR